MGSFCVSRAIDLGDFGQHSAIISGTTGDLGGIDSVTVEHKGAIVQLVHLLPRDLEDDLLTEIALDEADRLRDQADDRKLDERLEREA